MGTKSWLSHVSVCMDFTTFCEQLSDACAERAPAKVPSLRDGVVLRKRYTMGLRDLTMLMFGDDSPFMTDFDAAAKRTFCMTSMWALDAGGMLRRMRKYHNPPMRGLPPVPVVEHQALHIPDPCGQACVALFVASVSSPFVPFCEHFDVHIQVALTASGDAEVARGGHCCATEVEISWSMIWRRTPQRFVSSFLQNSTRHFCAHLQYYVAFQSTLDLHCPMMPTVAEVQFGDEKVRNAVHTSMHGTKHKFCLSRRTFAHDPIGGCVVSTGDRGPRLREQTQTVFGHTGAGGN